MARRSGARRLAGLLLGFWGAFGSWACGGDAQRDAAAPGSDGALTNEATEVVALPDEALNATWQELGVPGASNRPALAATPSGYFALSRRQLGDAKAPSGWESHLYRSTDGIRWQRVEVSADNGNLWLRGVAYGAGRYVLAGMRFGGGDGVIFHSTDAEHWQEIAVATGAPSGLSGVVFVGSRFFALSTFRTLLSSADGVAWSSVDLGTTVMPLDVTFGNGQYLVVGSGDVQRSSDGLRWLPAPLDCAMPGACITDPSGNVGQGLHNRAVFAAGVFFIDQAASLDGQTWQSLPGRYPLATAAGRVLGSTATDELAIWAPNEAPHALASVRYIDTLAGGDRATYMRWNGAVQPSELAAENFPSDLPLPERLEFPLPSGGDCTTASCVIVGERLYLIPTAP